MFSLGRSAGAAVRINKKICQPCQDHVKKLKLVEESPGNRAFSIVRLLTTVVQFEKEALDFSTSRTEGLGVGSAPR